MSTLNVQIPPNRVEELWKRFNSSVKQTLHVMRSSDFGKHGLNETGFKGIVLGAIVPLLNAQDKESVHSEVQLEGGYCDIVVLFPTINAAMIIELKYLQLLYFERTRWKAIENAKTGKEERRLLEEDLKPFKTLSQSDLDRLLYRDPATKQYDTTILTWVKRAQDQAVGYAKAMRDGGLTPFNPRPKVIYYGLMVGCACTSVHAIKKL